MCLKFQSRFCEKFLRQSLQKTPGLVKSGKMLAERNRLVGETKKDQKEPEVPAEGKKGARELKRRSQRLFASWRWRPGSLRNRSLLSS